MAQSQLMAVLNVTPDSFYASSRVPSVEEAVQRGIAYVEAGADILDIGGESTRPGATEVDEQEELARVVPVVAALAKEVAIPLSIDTRKAVVAKAALAAGASMLNDVSGFSDPAMQQLAIESGAKICVMHMRGIPKTMQDAPNYPEGVVEELIAFFLRRLEELMKRGVKEGQIVLDPGIGFGKSLEDNWEIIRNLNAFRALGFPLLIGLSRKSMLRKLLNKSTEELLTATVAMNTVCLLAGVEMIRVHDVQEHRAVIDLIGHYMGEQ